jgi:hypothetical protein
MRLRRNKKSKSSFTKAAPPLGRLTSVAVCGKVVLPGSK